MSAEIQRFQAILSKHLITSKKFTDEEFTPNSTTSIGGPYSKFPFKRASEINDQVSVFLEGIHPSDIKPGDLNDPYLLSAVACLAEEPTLIERLFLTEEANRAGLYAVWLCDNGVWRPIILDDFLPCHQIEGALVPAFAKTDRGEIWVSLLEKAYAKLHGSYLNIESGLCHHAMRDLTGAPVEELFDEKDPERVWNFINSSINRDYFVTCSMDLIEEGDEVAEPRDKGFAYTVLDAREVNGRRGEDRLILIRNPRESFDWVGAWSQTSDLWTEKLRKELSYPEDEEASLFWVTLEEYQKNFPVTWVCRYKKDNNYYSVNLTHTHNNSNVLRLIVKERQEVTISLNQHDRRSFKNSSHPDYFYSYARMLLGRVERNGLEYINGNASGYERNLQITHVLQPGVYLLTVEVNWNQNYHKNFNVSFYTDGELKIESLQEVDLLGIQKNIVKSAIEKTEHNKTVTNYGKYGDQDIHKTVDCIHGIFYFHYENSSRKRSKLCETIKFSQISNLKICSPFTNDNQFDVTVLPGSDLLVLYKSVLDDYSWGYSASFYIQGVSREDEKTPPNVYAYIDDPDNKTKIEVNNNYNLYVKENYNIDQNDHDGKALHGVIGNTLGRRIEEKAKQSTYAVENFEEDKQGYSDKYYEDRGSEYGHQDQYYYYSDKKEKEYEKSKASVADFLAPKRPKEYPVSVMQLGQTNSKKVKYTNYDNTEKDLLVTSSRPDIVLVKEPKLRVAGGETAEIRLRFHAPKEPGHYGVKVEIRSNKNPNPEEILQFPLEIRYD